MLGRFRLAFAGLLFSSLVTFAGAVEPPIRLPVAPAIPTPMPAPVPPGAALPLDGSQVAIVDADVECIVIESAPGIVKVDQLSGPRDFTAIFADGNGSDEDRTYKGKSLYRVRAVGTGTVTLSVVPVGVKSKDEIKTLTFSVDATASKRKKPCPDPKVDPKVDPVPDPKTDAPIPVPGFRVLIVYESGDASKMPPQQQNILYGKTVRDFLQANCVVGPDGKTKEFRIFDQDILGDSKVWQDAMKRTRDKAAAWQPKTDENGKVVGPASALPWLIISNPGKGGYEGPLPATPDEFLTLAKKYTEGK